MNKIIKVMVMRELGKIKSENDILKEDEMPSLDDYSDIEYQVDEKALMIIRSLNVQIKDDDVEKKKRISSMLDAI